MQIKNFHYLKIIVFVVPILLIGCGWEGKRIDNSVQDKDSTSFKNSLTANTFKNQIPIKAPEGMVWIYGGIFKQGAVKK